MLKFVFDLHGTILDDKRRVKNDALVAFEVLSRLYPEASFTIASGARLSQVEDAIRLIRYKLGRRIDFNIIANSGSVIKKSNGQLEVDSIDFNEYCNIVESIRNHAEKHLMVYRCDKRDYCIWPQSPVQSVIYHFLKQHGKKYFVEPSFLTDSHIREKIMTQKLMSILVVSPSMSRDVEKSIKGVGGQGLKASYSDKGLERFTLEISKNGKFGAINKLFGDTENIIYFGDSANDKECFQNAKLSFGFGKNYNAIKHATYLVDDFIQVLDALVFGQNKKVWKSSQIKREHLSQTPIQKAINAFLDMQDSRMKKYAYTHKYLSTNLKTEEDKNEKVDELVMGKV